MMEQQQFEGNSNFQPRGNNPRGPGEIADIAANRIVPQSIDAEVCVLGSMILDPTAMDIVVQMLKGEYFHRPAHETIYETLVEMREQAQKGTGQPKPIDLVLLREELERKKLIEIGRAHV